MANWQTVLASSEESLAKVNIRRGVFQSDNLSRLLFAICMTLLTYVVRKAKARNTLGRGQKINHLLFMDDVKVKPKFLVKKFCIKKCGVISVNRGKVKSTDEIELRKIEKVNTWGHWSMTEEKNKK